MEERENLRTSDIHQVEMDDILDVSASRVAVLGTEMGPHQPIRFIRTRKFHTAPRQIFVHVSWTW